MYNKIAEVAYERVPGRREKLAQGREKWLDGGGQDRGISARRIVTKVLTGSRGRSRERRQVSRYRYVLHANFRRTKSIMERGCFYAARGRRLEEEVIIGRNLPTKSNSPPRLAEVFRISPPSDYERHLSSFFLTE